MIFRQPVLSTFAVAASAVLCACAAPYGSPGGYDRDARVAPAPIAVAPAYAEFGQVRDIDVVPVASRPSGAGAVLGAVLGAVVGNQFGSGTGRAATTVAGAVGGGVAGNAIERRTRRDDEVFRVSVRFDNGDVRDFQFQRIDDLRVGDRVRYEGGQLYRN